jgi:hypothetical protein
MKLINSFQPHDFDFIALRRFNGCLAGSCLTELSIELLCVDVLLPPTPPDLCVLSSPLSQVVMNCFWPACILASVLPLLFPALLCPSVSPRDPQPAPRLPTHPSLLPGLLQLLSCASGSRLWRGTYSSISRTLYQYSARYSINGGF